jgi:hypothetical protein
MTCGRLENWQIVTKTASRDGEIKYDDSCLIGSKSGQYHEGGTMQRARHPGTIPDLDLLDRGMVR